MVGTCTRRPHVFRTQRHRYKSTLVYPRATLLSTAADKAAAEAAALAATERRKETARAALRALLADNAPHAAKDGIAMLRMLVANLVNQPNVPRYRRIASRCASIAGKEGVGAASVGPS